MSDFDPMDFQPNSVGVMVVRTIRLKDIITALACTEAFALEVVREIRGETSKDLKLAFVLPSQLAAWTYKQAGKREEARSRAPGEDASALAGVRFKTVLVKDASSPVAALRMAATSDSSSSERISAGTALKSIREELRELKSGLALHRGTVAVTAEQAARLLGCGRTTVFALLRDGKLKPSKRTGRRTMISLASIEAWMAHPTDSAPSTPSPTQASAPSRSGRLGKAIRRLPV